MCHNDLYCSKRISVGSAMLITRCSISVQIHKCDMYCDKPARSLKPQSHRVCEQVTS